MPHIVFINRSYYPDSEATGQLLTELCQDLATKNFQVTVIAGQPNQNPQNIAYRTWGVEQHRGVTIRRVWNTRFPKRWLLFRAINLLTYLVTATITSLTLRNRPDLLVVETDPPLLCILGAFLKRRYRCQLIIYLQDLYPDLAVALGKLRNGQVTKWLRRMFLRAYARAEQVIVLSKDMRNVLLESGIDAKKIAIVPNWTDCEQVRPLKQNNVFREKVVGRQWSGISKEKQLSSANNGQRTTDNLFVVMYSGNMGMCQGLENILAAAERLADRKEIVFLFVGDGAKRRELERTAEARTITNVQFLDYQPKSELSFSLSAADVHLVPLDPRVRNYLMPSKLYGALASGTPVIAIAQQDCELAQLVTQNDVGYVVEPNQPDELATLIEQIANQPNQLTPLGIRARQLAEQQFDRDISVDRFAELMNRLLGIHPELKPEALAKARPTHVEA